MLSQNFTIGMLSKTNHRQYIEKNRQEAEKYIVNLRKLCIKILEPIKTIVGPFVINSGFRCNGLNKAIGGSITSQHSYGEAADIEFLNIPLKDAFNKIAFSNIPYSQIIFEFGQWIHVGLIDETMYPGKIGQKLIASKDKNKTVYKIITEPIG